MKMPEMLDNVSKTVKDDLAISIQKGDKLSIAAACFSIYAYQVLKKQLDGIAELRFIFTSPTFLKESAPRESREFYIPRLDRERSLYGTEFEVKLRTPQSRDMIKNQIESVVWRNKLADSTMGISAGENIKEIQVFEIQLRQKELDKRILPAIAKAIPYKILFVLVFGDESQAWIEASGTFYNTDWLPLNELTLKFEGLNLDAVYGNLARQIAEGRLSESGDISKAVESDIRRQKLEREIAAIEKKMLREKQFNKQVELNAELKKLMKELEALGKCVE